MIKRAWPWIGCVLVLAGSAGIDLGTHLYSQLFRCPPVEKGTVRKRPDLPRQWQNDYTSLEVLETTKRVAYLKQSFLKSGFHVSEFTGYLLAEREGTKERSEGVFLTTRPPTGNGGEGREEPSAWVAALGIARELPPTDRTIRIAIPFTAGNRLEEALGSWRRIRALIVLGSLMHFNPSPGSQRYQHLSGHAYPDRGDFLAFQAGPEAKGVTHVAASFFQRYADTPAQCFKTFRWVSPAVPLPPIGWSEPVGVPFVVISDTGEFRTGEKGALPIDRMADITLGLAKMIEGLGNDPNESFATPPPIKRLSGL